MIDPSLLPDRVTIKRQRDADGKYETKYTLVPFWVGNVTQGSGGNFPGIGRLETSIPTGFCQIDVDLKLNDIVVDQRGEAWQVGPVNKLRMDGFMDHIEAPIYRTEMPLE